MTKEIKTHPVQTRTNTGSRGPSARCPVTVTMAAYEVYCAVYGSQEALITGGCRGGFGTGELIAFLYARAFPRNEWRMRVDEAFNGAVNL